MPSHSGMPKVKCLYAAGSQMNGFQPNGICFLGIQILRLPSRLNQKSGTYNPATCILANPPGDFDVLHEI